MISIVKDADAPIGMERIHKPHQRTWPFRELKAVQQLLSWLLRLLRQTASHHVSQMHLGQFVVAEIQALISIAAQGGQQIRSVLDILDLNSHKNVGLITSAHPIAEFREAALLKEFGQLAQAAGLFRNLHGEHGFTLFTKLGPFRNKAQTVEIHVGAAGDRHKLLIF